MKQNETFDVIIAGGGLAGLAMAVAIGGPCTRNPLRTLVVDQGDPAVRAANNSDRRGSAITESSRLMLEAIGIWADLAEHSQPITEIIVTDSRLGDDIRPVFLGFDESLLRDRPSAHMVENGPLYRSIFRQAEASRHISILSGATVSGASFDGSRAELTIDRGPALLAPLTIAADGRHSKLRQIAGIETTGWNYRQSALVLSVAIERNHNGRAEEHFLPAGPFAILPLKDRRVSLVWTEATEEAQRLRSLAPDAFLDSLRKRFGGHLGEISIDSEVQVYPLSLSFAREFTHDRLALIGDAAHVIHPIAGLGFNLGLRDVAALAEVVQNAASLGQDIGARDMLQPYEQWRRFDTANVMFATDALNHLFSNDNSTIRTVRDLGLKAVDQFAGMKTAFMNTAAGFSGNTPKLLTGQRL